MNKKIEILATILGLDIKEEFKLTGYNDIKFRFSKKSLQYYDSFIKKWKNVDEDKEYIYADLLTEKIKVVYLKEKPHDYMGCSNLEQDPRQDIWTLQRIKNGYCASDSWNMDWWFLQTIPKMLKDYKEAPTYPGNLTKEEWESKLQEIINCFNISSDDYWYSDEKTAKENHKKIVKGLKLLGEIFEDLWI